jgi:hypothetical protein
MPTDIDPHAAFDHLLNTLTKMRQSGLVAEIQKAVATGTLAEIEVQRGKIEETRRAYAPIDAYLIAVRLVVAAIDPLIMEEDARKHLANLENAEAEVKWLPDYLEGAEPSPDALEVSAIPSVAYNDLNRLRDAAVRVLGLVNTIEAENR